MSCINSYYIMSLAFTYILLDMTDVSMYIRSRRALHLSVQEMPLHIHIPIVAKQFPHSQSDSMVLWRLVVGDLVPNVSCTESEE